MALVDLLHMPPRMPARYLLNSVLGYAELSGDSCQVMKRIAWNVARTDHADSIRREFRHAVAETTCVPSLPMFVAVVLGDVAQEQMCGFTTGGVVAAMADGHASGDFTKRQRVSETMCASSLAILPVRSTANVEVPVAVAINRPCELQAPVRSSLERRAETFFGCSSAHEHCMRGVGAAVAPPSFVVRVAPPAGVDHSRASINGTGRLIRHRILHRFGVMGPGAPTPRPLHFTTVAGLV